MKANDVIFCSECQAAGLPDSGPARDHWGHDTSGFGGQLQFCPICEDFYYSQPNNVSWGNLVCYNCEEEYRRSYSNRVIRIYNDAEFRLKAFEKYGEINNRTVRLAKREEARKAG